jgi:hypothetical protein
LQFENEHRFEKWATLLEDLRRLNLDQLERLASVVCSDLDADEPASPPPPKPEPRAGLLPSQYDRDRYANLIDRIHYHMLQPDLVLALWDELADLEKCAVRESLYLNRGYFGSSQFKARYGVLPDFGEMAWRKWHSDTPPPKIRAFFPSGRIPIDVARILIRFVQQPELPTIDAVDEIPPTHMRIDIERELFLVDDDDCVAGTASSAFKSRRWEKKEKRTITHVPFTTCDTADFALRDLLKVLRLAETGKIAISEQTTRPTRETISLIASQLSAGDFFATTKFHSEVHSMAVEIDKALGPIRSYAWPCLLLAARLAVIRGGKLVLTKAGLNALDAPPVATIKHMWECWRETVMFDEFQRIHVIKGQYGNEALHARKDHERRRFKIVEALRSSPQGKWVSTQELSRFMVASCLTFDVLETRILSIETFKYDRFGFTRDDDWKNLGMRYTLCFLMEYAATLGLIDVAYVRPEQSGRNEFKVTETLANIPFLSRYDGLCYYRINALGAFCLGLKDKYIDPLTDARTPITVMPNLLVTLLEDSDAAHPEVSCLLDRYADRETDSSWRLSRNKALAAVERGSRISELEHFLQSHDEQPLPETVEGFIKETQKNSHALKKTGTALIIECADEEIANKIATHDRTKKLCQKLGKQNLVVNTADEEPFRKAINIIGYGMPRD